MKPILKVLIVGSRSFCNYELLKDIVSASIAPYTNSHEIVVISGGAKGADKMGECYADNMGYKKEIYLANWNDKSSPTYNHYKGYDPRAGHMRNAVMREAVLKSDKCMCLAFWDGTSRGTKENFAPLKAKKIPTTVCIYNNKNQLEDCYML